MIQAVESANGSVETLRNNLVATGMSAENVDKVFLEFGLTTQKTTVDTQKMGMALSTAGTALVMLSAAMDPE